MQSASKALENGEIEDRETENQGKWTLPLNLRHGIRRDGQTIVLSQLTHM